MSYGTPPPPPPSYGGAPYGQQQPQSTNGKAIAALVLGILGVFPCCSIFIFGILGIVFGSIAKKEIENSNGAQKGLGMAKWGLYLGIAGIVLAVLYWILYAVGAVHYNATFQKNS
ncbi:DUF4190 domain-containing protein [Nocardioides sp. DS6]|uniref:DUF4190 domain-containing protein n=1 Tax=Nocardioides eburneus TaxID=3231482 RepID=A0ABV3SY96_9ACTN